MEPPTSGTSTDDVTMVTATSDTVKVNVTMVTATSDTVKDDVTMVTATSDTVKDDVTMVTATSDTVKDDVTMEIASSDTVTQQEKWDKNMILYPAKLTASTIPSVTTNPKLTTPAVTMMSVTSASSSMAGQPSASAGQHNNRQTPVHDAVVQTPLGFDLWPSADTEQIPEAVPRAEFRSIPIPQNAVTVIAMDLETTDLIHCQRMPQIMQIAAENVSTSDSFDIYVIPKENITLEAQRRTSIVYSNGVMTVHGTKVEPVCIQTALRRFCHWLSKFPNVILLAHNGRKFDFPVLISAFEHNSLTHKLKEYVSGCVDSLTFFKKAFPYQKSFKLVDLVHSILNTSFTAHDAVAGVSALKALHNNTSASMEDLMQYSFSVKAVQTNLLYLKEKATNMPSLTTLVANGVCKTSTAENIAGSGLNLSHLQLICRRDGIDGLLDVFQGDNSEGQPRVTSSKRVLESVIPKLVDYFIEK